MTVRGDRIEEMGRGVFDKERVWEEGGFRCNGLNSKIRGMIRGLVFVESCCKIIIRTIYLNLITYWSIGEKVNLINFNINLIILYV